MIHMDELWGREILGMVWAKKQVFTFQFCPWSLVDVTVAHQVQHGNSRWDKNRSFQNQLMKNYWTLCFYQLILFSVYEAEHFGLNSILTFCEFNFPPHKFPHLLYSHNNFFPSNIILICEELHVHTVFKLQNAHVILSSPLFHTILSFIW